MFENQNSGLHLPDLLVRNFRGLQDLSIKKLGHVTLIAGRNGVGKTTLLDALQAYATRGSQKEFGRLLKRKEEYVGTSYAGQISFSDYNTLFFGRQAIRGRPISIGPVSSNQNRLEIHLETVEDIFFPEQELMVREMFDPKMEILRIQFQNGKSYFPLRCDTPELAQSFRDLIRLLKRLRLMDSDLPDPVACTLLGPGLPNNQMLANFWNKIVLTEEESIALEALNMTGMSIDRVALARENNGDTHADSNYFIVKYRNYQRVSLKSLGDGVTRLFAAGLALAASRNGLLLIDEMENGLHYSIIKDVWNMIMKVAKRHNIQVFATTHSLDCIRAFAYAADENEETESVLIRLGSRQEKICAIEYTEEELKVASEQGIEVR